MKTKSNKVLIYDNQCPMCTAYSAAFVKSGMLGSEERVGFQELKEQDYICRLDIERASREIPLVDLETGEIRYGVDALLHLLGERFPGTERLLRKGFFFKSLTKLYAFISLNRRIIVPPGNKLQGMDFAPPFDPKSRIRLLTVAILFASIVSVGFGLSIGHYVIVSGIGWKMLVAVGAGWGLQLAVTASLIRNQQQRLDYASHLGVLMVIGVLFLIPSLPLSAFTHFRYPLIPAISVLISSGVMLYQHIKRIKALGLSQRWTVSWFLSLQLAAWSSVWIYYLNHAQ